MAATPIRYFYSYLSPYSYIADCRMADVLAPFDIELEYLPVLPPPDAEGKRLKTRLPGEMEYIRQDAPRVAKHFGIPFTWFQGYPDCWNLTLGFHAVQELDGDWMAYHKAAFRARFVDATDPAAPETLRALAQEAEVDPDAFMRELESRAVQEAHMGTLMKARDAGLFGVPIFVLPSGERFWGQDRLEYLAEALRDGRE